MLVNRRNGEIQIFGRDGNNVGEQAERRDCGCRRIGGTAKFWIGAFGRETPSLNIDVVAALALPNARRIPRQCILVRSLFKREFLLYPSVTLQFRKYACWSRISVDDSSSVQKILSTSQHLIVILVKSFRVSKNLYISNYN